MDIDYSAIRDLPQAAHLSDEDWNLFVERTRTKRIPKGVTLIQAGQLVKHAYFCTMGLFRLYYTLQDGREYNVAFTVENDFATSYGAMVMGTPSFFTIEAMEDSAVIEISFDVLKELMDKSRAWERFVYKSVERLYIRKEERERELLYLTAKERYDVFLVKYPGLGHRIPQYHIASYLGITPVSLSRILHSEKD
ncbi:Crp/Fnr family transcriptional regulator [Paenibacillus sp. P32E]|uniref:Crp/Fnr family transcriptional regulator n=1 Tax=Paenibacillus sp. P32E TaxID=1349434 RepID=UPI00093A8B73|nr:Crp/Fnr family transcriptional regulator [Paenibacillus sp. P32E]OKP82921.1 Crp/Fnr family transcriptional regulator [Paenibacillus sp. P32E]